MEIKECIKGRRSVRKYAYEKIEREVIETMVKAGQYAPSWKNSQTPRYYAAITEEGIEAVRTCLPDFNAERTEGVVGIGSTVVCVNKAYDTEIEYNIVGSAEADPLNNKISDESPIGQALIGAKVGETITVTAPMGDIEFEIKEVK